VLTLLPALDRSRRSQRELNVHRPAALRMHRLPSHRPEADGSDSRLAFRKPAIRFPHDRPTFASGKIQLLQQRLVAGLVCGLIDFGNSGNLPEVLWGCSRARGNQSAEFAGKPVLVTGSVTSRGTARTRSPYFFTKSSSRFVSRAVATSRSPDSSTALRNVSAQTARAAGD